MPFNISSFKDEIQSNGVLHSNKYLVQITPPPVMQGFSISNDNTDGVQTTNMSDVSQQMAFRCDDVILASRSHSVSEVYRYGYGMSRKMPYDYLHDIAYLTFISDRYGTIWQYFYLWMNNVIEFADTSSNHLPGNYYVGYKSDFITDMQIFNYDNTGNVAITHTLTEAYPFGVNAVRFNWDTANQLLKIHVAMTFTTDIIQGSLTNQ